MDLDLFLAFGMLTESFDSGDELEQLTAAVAFRLCLIQME
jgi:hypothetical protein